MPPLKTNDLTYASCCNKHIIYAIFLVKYLNLYMGNNFKFVETLHSNTADTPQKYIHTNQGKGGTFLD